MTDINGRFIRITVNGNTQNNYASITELSVDLVSTPNLSAFSIAVVRDWGSGRNDKWKKTVQLMVDNKVNLARGLWDYSYGSMSDFQPVVNQLKKAGIPMKGAKWIIIQIHMLDFLNIHQWYTLLMRDQIKQ